MKHTVLEDAGGAGGYDAVLVTVLPSMERITVARPAALHLYRLLQRYNWCLDDVAQYRVRWSDFWPAISGIERKIFSLFIKANCEGAFGGRLQVQAAPVDFEVFEGDARPVLLVPSVATEFRRIIGLHHARLAAPTEVREWLVKRRPNEYAVVVAEGLESDLLEEEHGRHPDLVGERFKEAFLAAGWSWRAATEAAAALTGEIEWFFNSKERALC